MKRLPMEPVRTIVFAKAPCPGLAKTRLIPALGARGAALLARRMLAHTLSAALNARIGPVELCAAPTVGDPAWADVVLPNGVELTAQGGGDLGARMRRAAARALTHAEAVLLVGTDCVQMSPALLRDAATMLLDTDAVLHPTTDGGYAVLGLKRFDARLFDDIAWSTATVAATTITRLAAIGWRTRVGRILHDVDEPEDLERLDGAMLDDLACDAL